MERINGAFMESLKGELLVTDRCQGRRGGESRDAVIWLANRARAF